MNFKPVEVKFRTEEQTLRTKVGTGKVRSRISTEFDYQNSSI